MDQSELNGVILEEHLPSYLIRIHPGGKTIYLILLILILSILVSLPLLTVQVSISGKGIIRPIQDKTRIVASSSGIVDKVFVKEGQSIHKSEPLLQVRSIGSQKNLKTMYTRLDEVMIHVNDLARLTSYPMKIPISEEYLREYQEYVDQVEYLSLHQQKSEKELRRHTGLFQNGLISEKEYDDLLYQKQKAEKGLKNYISKSLNRWQNEYYRQLAGKRDLQIQIRNAEEKIRLTTILAPARGSMIEFNGIYEGSAIQVGSVIGILSPESRLIGEFYISSKNIAFMNIGQKVNIHLDAFNAREWGFVTADIFEISSDFIIQENRPVYRIKCRLDQTSLGLKNGYTSEIKKGMTFQARCLLQRRTLFQLMTDKAENWLHPAISRQEIHLQP